MKQYQLQSELMQMMLPVRIDQLRAPLRVRCEPAFNSQVKS